MDSWNYLHSLGKNGNNFCSTCPYCGELFHILSKSFKVQFKIPKISPEGANDLNLFYITPQIFTKRYALCSKCGAKYDYDKLNDSQNVLAEIPSSTILLNDFVYKELLKYPRNTTCELLWRKRCRKKRLIKKSYHKVLNQFYKLKGMLF